MLRPAITALLLTACLVLPIAAGPAADLLEAAKKGDAAAVKELLTGGTDVNARNSYGATALALAADRGHVEVVRLLLQHNADVNAKDTFYKASPLDWAVMRNHAGVIQALVEAGADGAAGALQNAAAMDQVEVVRAILEKAKLKEDVLTKALAVTPAKSTAVAELLRKAGAKSAAKANETAAGDALKPYVGTYRSDDSLELTIAVDDGQLCARAGTAPAMRLEAAGPPAFRTPDGTLTITFRREADQVNALTLKRDTTEVVLRRVDAAQEPAPLSAKVEDAGGVVKEPLNWPSFRGPNASGVADGQFPPVVWDAEKNINVRWKTPIPGLGHSCPAVWEDRIYITTAVSSDGKAELRPGQYGDVDSVKESGEQSWQVYCLDKQSGKVLWERTACRGVPKVKRHPKASHANPTPATDGQHLVVSFGSEGLYCYDRDGQLLWEKNLGVLNAGWFYDADYQWGFGSSPVLYHDLVIVQCDVGKGSFLAAYEVADGREVWRTERDEIPSWGTPTIVEGPDRVELVTNATKYARGYDPWTGEELWRLGRHAEITVPTPLFAEGLIFLTSGYRPVQPIYALRPGAVGDVTLPEGKSTSDVVAWSTTKGGPYMPTPLVYGGHLFTCSNAGILTCYDAKTGKQVYKERLGGRSGYTASPVAADGKLYFAGEDGVVRVVRAGPKFELLAANPLGDACLATPAVSDGIIFVRTQHYLFALGRPEGPKE